MILFEFNGGASCVSHFLAAYIDPSPAVLGEDEERAARYICVSFVTTAYNNQSIYRSRFEPYIALTIFTRSFLVHHAAHLSLFSPYSSPSPSLPPCSLQHEPRASTCRHGHPSQRRQPSGRLFQRNYFGTICSASFCSFFFFTSFLLCCLSSSSSLFLSLSPSSILLFTY